MRRSKTPKSADTWDLNETMSPKFCFPPRPLNSAIFKVRHHWSAIFKPRGPCQPCQGLQFATRLATSGVGHAMTWMMERPTVLSPVGFVLRAPRSRSRHSFIFLGYDCGGPWMTLVYDRVSLSNLVGAFEIEESLRLLFQIQKE